MFVQLGSGPDTLPSSWRLYKLGRPVSPLDVVVNGSKSMHAVSDEGVHVDSVVSGDCSQRLVVRCVQTCCDGLFIVYSTEVWTPRSCPLGHRPRFQTPTPTLTYERV